MTGSLNPAEVNNVNQQRAWEQSWTLSHSQRESADISWHLHFHNAPLWLNGLETADRLAVLSISEAKVPGYFPTYALMKGLQPLKTLASLFHLLCGFEFTSHDLGREEGKWCIRLPHEYITHINICRNFSKTYMLELQCCHPTLETANSSPLWSACLLFAESTSLKQD